MKKLIALSTLAVALLAGSGCTNLAKVVRELKDDPAQVTLHVSSIYGTVRFTRNGSPTNAIGVLADGTVTPVLPAAAAAPVNITVTNVTARSR